MSLACVGFFWQRYYLKLFNVYLGSTQTLQSETAALRLWLIFYWMILEGNVRQSLITMWKKKQVAVLAAV